MGSILIESGIWVRVLVLKDMRRLSGEVTNATESPSISTCFTFVTDTIVPAHICEDESQTEGYRSRKVYEHEFVIDKIMNHTFEMRYIFFMFVCLGKLKARTDDNPRNIYRAAMECSTSLPKICLFHISGLFGAQWSDDD